MIKGLYEAHLPVSNLENSIHFYEKLGLELAWSNQAIAFFWIEKGKSWLGLWQADQVNHPYHPSIRHVAFRVELEDMLKAQEWLKERGIAVKADMGFLPHQQPLVLANNPHAHGAIYFNDPDGNSLELITPLAIDSTEVFEKMELSKWLKR
jgi:catechol 2,3-dioxygenase-like lactoylglutathione lyase family enzyme